MLYLVRMDVHLPLDMPSTRSDEIKAHAGFTPANSCACLSTTQKFGYPLFLECCNTFLAVFACRQ